MIEVLGLLTESPAFESHWFSTFLLFHPMALVSIYILSSIPEMRRWFMTYFRGDVKSSVLGDFLAVYIIGV